MTSQYTDIFRYQGKEYSLIGINGVGLFEPRGYGLEPVMICTACYRGFVCQYEISDTEILMKNLLIMTDKEEKYPEIEGVKPTFDNTFQAGEYKNLSISIRFTGGILLGNEFIEDMYVHMGFQKPHAFREVKEIIFKEGKITEMKDHSEKMKEIRERMEEVGKEGADQIPSRDEIEKWIGYCFELDYSKWGIF